VPFIPKTRATNKTGLNGKSISNPSLKKREPIVVDDDISESTPGNIRKEATTIKTLKDMPMRKTTKRQKVTSGVKIPK
jgi:hypothetical protein